MPPTIHVEHDWKQAAALAAIHEAGREIAASLDLDRTLRLVMQKAAETLPIDAGALFIRDETSQLYRVAVSHNLPPEQVDKITFAFEEGVPGWAVLHHHPLIIDDARTDARVHPTVVAAGVLSVLAMPLISRERVVGVLNLFCQSNTHAFDDDALQLAQVFADQAAVFLENARLMDELRHWAAELEQRVAERTRQLQQKQAQIIQAEKMAAVGRLAATVAHEVNNPLQAIALHLQLLADENSTGQGEQHLAVVQQEFGRIAIMVERLLDFQRPAKGQPQVVQLAQIAADVLALTSQQLQRGNVELIYNLPTDLPPVLAVGNQLKQVFLNLVLNAVEAMPDGGRLTIDAIQEHNHVQVRFRDTGPGIPEEVMAQLFEPFFTTKANGSGLGLAITHEIVTNHGGALTAVSQPGAGATFTVLLPVYVAEDSRWMK